MMYACSI
jgi:hypothetical protein